VTRAIQENSKLDKNGKIIKIDMKRLKSEHIMEMVRKNRSLDEQNKYLTKYL